MPEFVKEYDHLFHSIGKHKNIQVKLIVDENVKPVTQKSHTIPYHRHLKETGWQQLKTAHTRLCIGALGKIMLTFLSAPFMGKSWGNPGEVSFL